MSDDWTEKFISLCRDHNLSGMERAAEICEANCTSDSRHIYGFLCVHCQDAAEIRAEIARIKEST